MEYAFRAYVHASKVSLWAKAETVHTGGLLKTISLLGSKPSFS
jgi:hypothetical protein